jgi:hypothetical protein
LPLFNSRDLNPTDYSFLLSHPEAVNERQTDALEKIVTEFPYFQSARALRLKGLYNQNSFQYNYALKVTAAYTTDRSVLFDFITSDSFTAIQKGLYEQKLAEIEGITVKDSQVIGDEEKQERPTDTELAKQSILTSIREAENRETDATELIDGKQLEEINAEDFGPVTDEPQFLPEAIAPVEFMHVEPVEVEAEFTAPEVEAETVETITVEQIDEPVLTENEPEIETETAVEITDTAETVATEAEPSESDKIETELIEQTRDEVELSEAKLEIGKPLAFSKDETHSFQEWLQLSKLQPIVRDDSPEEKNAADTPNTGLMAEPETQTSAEKVTKDALIDRFIETNPKMPRVKPDVTPVAFEQKEDTSALMTETLARVYLEQRKYQKAIQAYEILILKYPEKSSFFADRISEIKNLQQNNIL